MNHLFSKLVITVVSILVLNAGNTLKAQISHGGTPLFYAPPSLLKSAGNNDFFIEMPSFDIDSLLKEDELNESNMRGAFHFAHKFHVSIEKGKTGNNYTLPDGTKVWQVGIRSNGAHSINVFFSEYKMPPGGKLFLYNSDRTHVIGSFTHENNSQDNILPIQPVAGDEIIVEYQEPAESEFEARLKITEVNHDYRDIFRYEPKPDPPGTAYNCMPDVLCADPGNDNIRSVVLVTINGTVACTGALLNTTNNDGEPVVLTAVHCLNNNFENPNVDYAQVAGTVVCFFNYNRPPVCNQNSTVQRMKGTQEMSLSGAVPLSIVVRNDMALLRLNDTPPDYYQPYYAGWNISSNAGAGAPFVNIHHPEGLVSKYGSVNTNLAMSSYPATFFNSGSHWRISSWSVGSTAGGSSGSPLFDNQGLLIGGLTGGQSTCSSGASDYFFALYKSWTYAPYIGQLLRNSLDPKNLGVTEWSGYDPYKKNPLIRLRNGDYSNGDKLVNSEMTNLGLVFGHDSLKMTAFAEEFSTGKIVELVGVYLLNPVTLIKASSPSPVKINVYKNALREEDLIASEVFHPTYSTYDSSSGSFVEKDKTMFSVPTESFVKFREEVSAGTKFYISYEIVYPSGRDFSVYNMIFDSPEKNSAWFRDANGNWSPATKHPIMPMSAGLAIEPLVRYELGADTFPPVQKKNIIIYLKALKKLQIDTDNPDEKGIINIYSIAGQLLYKTPYQGRNPVSISSISGSNIIIVKVQSEGRAQTSKIVL